MTKDKNENTLPAHAHTHTHREIHTRKQLIQFKKKREKTIINQMVIDKRLVKIIVNIDGDNNDNDEYETSFDRRCILFIFASDVERSANNVLRALSSRKKKRRNIFLEFSK